MSVVQLLLNWKKFKQKEPSFSEHDHKGVREWPQRPVSHGMGKAVDYFKQNHFQMTLLLI